MNFDASFDRLLGFEGGYSFNAADPGGETMWGITLKTALLNGYRGEMRLMPRDFAKGVYLRSYWQAVRADELPQGLRYAVFDAAVNSGPAQAIKWLQRAVGASEDGVLGPVTLGSAKAYPEDRTLRRMLGYRLKTMRDLPQWGAFSRGWADRIASLLTQE